MKHVTQAGILTMEARQGYPHHRWWALGHLAEASDELVADYEEQANEIREYRKQYEDDEDVQLPYHEIIAMLSKLIEGETEDARQLHAKRTGRRSNTRTRK
jgi:hypothetical protein